MHLVEIIISSGSKHRIFVKTWTPGSPANLGELFISLLGDLSHSSSPKKLTKAFLAIPSL